MAKNRSAVFRWGLPYHNHAWKSVEHLTPALIVEGIWGHDLMPADEGTGYGCARCGMLVAVYSGSTGLWYEFSGATDDCGASANRPISTWSPDVTLSTDMALHLKWQKGDG